MKRRVDHIPSTVTVVGSGGAVEPISNTSVVLLTFIACPLAYLCFYHYCCAQGVFSMINMINWNEDSN